VLNEERRFRVGYLQGVRLIAGSNKEEMRPSCHAALIGSNNAHNRGRTSAPGGGGYYRATFGKGRESRIARVKWPVGRVRPQDAQVRKSALFGMGVPGQRKSLIS